jgi:hypothetical protein
LVPLQGHIEETLLTPRFYTTNFDEMEQLFSKELGPHLKDEQFVTMLQEMAADYNQTHFVRNENFRAAAEKLKGPTRLAADMCKTEIQLARPSTIMLHVPTERVQLVGNLQQ